MLIIRKFELTSQLVSAIFICIGIHVRTTVTAVTLAIDHDGGIIRVGETARFECVYSGLEPVTWVINGYYYTSSNLPEKHSVDSNNNGILIATNVDLMMNGSTYQCFVQSMFSNSVYLYVESDLKPYSSLSASPVLDLLTTITHSQILYTNTKLKVMMTSAVTQRNINEYTPNHMHSSKGTIVTLSVLVPGSFIFGLGLATIVFFLILLRIRKKFKILYTQESQQAPQTSMPYNTLSATFIKTNRNEAYDNIVLARHALSSSPLNHSSQNPIYERINDISIAPQTQS